MHQIKRDDLDERINDFIARKTAPKNLSQLIADRLTSGQEASSPRRGERYEFLPLKRRFSRGH